MKLFSNDYVRPRMETILTDENGSIYPNNSGELTLCNMINGTSPCVYRMGDMFICCNPDIWFGEKGLWDNEIGKDENKNHIMVLGSNVNDLVEKGAFVELSDEEVINEIEKLLNGEFSYLIDFKRVFTKEEIMILPCK